MLRWRRPAVGLATMAALLLGMSGCGFAAGPPAAPPEPTAEAIQPAAKREVEDRAAQGLLERYRRDKAVEDDQKDFLAEQHFKTGKAHFEMGDWERARKQFVTALELNPNHADASAYLRRTQSVLGAAQRTAGGLIEDIVNQRAVGLEVQKMELRNLFEEAKRLYEQGRYREAIDRFERVQAQARYLAPILNAGGMFEDAAVGERKAREALERQRQEQQKQRMREAIEESRRLREERRSYLERQTGALLAQANALHEQGRYREARSVCSEMLRRDPRHGAAEALLTKSTEAHRNVEVTHALQNRRSATDHHMREVVSWTVPQADLVSMPPEVYEQVRNRKAPVYFLGEAQEPEPWEKRIRETLASQRISFDFVETPLPDVLAFLASLTDVTIILDQDSIKDTHPTVTLRVNDMTLERALNWICKLASLKYSLRNEAIYVARPEKLHDQEVLRIYDVSDLTMELKHFKGRQRALSTGEGYGREGGSNIGEDFFRLDEDEEEEEEFSGDSLIEFIRQVIGPGTWDDEKARGFIGEPFSVIPRDAHREGTSLSGQELVDIIALTVGSRTWVGVRTKE